MLLLFSKMTREIKQYVTELTAATEEKHAILAQLEVAAQIQQGTLPNLAEVNASLQAKKNDYIIKAGMLSAKLVGGDMYDCYLLGSDKLLLFTDGLNEAENNLHEFYGNERLQQVFLHARSPEEIMEEISHFVADAPPCDDKTYLWIERV